MFAGNYLPCLASPFPYIALLLVLCLAEYQFVFQWKWHTSMACARAVIGIGSWLPNYLSQGSTFKPLVYWNTSANIVSSKNIWRFCGNMELTYANGLCFGAIPSRSMTSVRHELHKSKQSGPPVPSLSLSPNSTWTLFNTAGVFRSGICHIGSL